MPGKIADSSVIAAILFGERLGQEAGALLGDDELLEPALLMYELASVARKKIQIEPQREGEIIRGLRLITSFNIRWFDLTDAPGLVTLASMSKLSVYDASYLQLAQSTGGFLYTFDRKLADAYRALGK